MTNPIELPSGKLLDLDRFIALVPDHKNQEKECQLILEGYPQPIKIYEEDFVILKKKLGQTKDKKLDNHDQENYQKQQEKNQPLMDLIKRWLEQKNNLIYTSEEEQEYQDIQESLLSNRIN
jgi:hypothetical protein